LLMIVAKAVAGVPTTTDRLDGRTAASRELLGPVVWAKFADTLCAWVIGTRQLPTPLQAPPQPVKANPASGTTVRLTTVTGVKLAVQVEPQLMPVGVLNTLPLPLTLTLSGKTCSVKLALTLVSAPSATMQVPMPLHAPPQPLNTKPAAGAAVRVTEVPRG